MPSISLPVAPLANAPDGVSRLHEDIAATVSKEFAAARVAETALNIHSTPMNNGSITMDTDVTTDTQQVASLADLSVQAVTTQADRSSGAPSSSHDLSQSHTITPTGLDVKDEKSEENMRMFVGLPVGKAAEQRRRNYARTSCLSDYEADLTSKDRTTQKEAVRKYLAEKVKQNWTFQWPPPVTDEPITVQTFEDIDGSSIELEEYRWKERDEWLSNTSLSGDDMNRPNSISLSNPDVCSTRAGVLYCGSAENLPDSITQSLYERKKIRQKRVKDEMEWNDGLRCFEARRDAWTCARKASKPVPSFLSPTSDGTESCLSRGFGVEEALEIPIAPSIIPPENAMRASITPTSYNIIYDKVVTQSLAPSCPMNLKDVTRSCVLGWKRSGEWGPKEPLPQTAAEERRRAPGRMSVTSLFGKSEDKGEVTVAKVGDAERPHNDNTSRTTVGRRGIRASLRSILGKGSRNST